MKKIPLLFRPYFKQVIWGGDKICSYKGVEQPYDKIGESWEISAIKGHESVVDAGPYAGRSLPELIDEFGEDLLGGKVMEKYGKEFPLLIKLIDARDDLSVQVHPDDKLARERHSCPGKTEMWYVVSADDDAGIYAGLSKSLDPEEYEKMVADGTFMQALARHESRGGDVFFLPAGRVHAIGGGNLIAEIQQPSDITYRIYDFDRRDANGNTRELHTALAKDAIDYKVYDQYKTRPVKIDDRLTELVHCEFFEVDKLAVEGECELPLSPDTFTIVMCTSGNVRLRYPEGDMELHQGGTLLLPAVMTYVKLDGKGDLLVIRPQ